VQVDPVKPTLKPLEIKRLRRKSHEVVSNFAFRFNVRRYRLVSFGVSEQVFEMLRDMAGCRKLITHVESTWFQRLQL
jgi:hypothetical protein